MADLLERIHTRHESVTNQKLIANFQSVIDVQTEYLGRIEGMRQYCKPGYADTSGVASDGVCINRSPGDILRNYGLRIEDVRQFVGSGAVLDIGCGQSALLDAFPDAHTTAVDANENSVKHQRRRGHEGITANATNLEQIPRGVGKLVVAHFSVPFWLRTREEAVKSAAELLRVTADEGLLLVGQIGTASENQCNEGVVTGLRYGGNSTFPWDLDDENFERAYAQVAFMEYMLKRQRQGDLLDGSTEVIGMRRWTSRSYDYRRTTKQLHVPNYFIIHKIST